MKNQVSILPKDLKKLKGVLLAAFVAVSSGCSSIAKIGNGDDIELDVHDNPNTVEMIKNNAVKTITKEANDFVNNYIPKFPPILEKYSSCNTEYDTIVENKVVKYKLEYDFKSYSARDLYSIINNTIDVAKGYKVLGVTRNRSGVFFDYEFKMYPTENGNLCVQIGELKTENIIKQEVYAASDYVDDKCRQERIKKHEDLHVFFNDTTFTSYNNVLRRFLDKIVAPVNGIQIPADIDDDEYQEILSAIDIYIGEAIYDFNKKRQNTSDKLHAPMDSIEAYDKYSRNTAKICGPDKTVKNSGSKSKPKI